MEGSLASFANPSIQNGYYQFVQTTAPTQRSSGVPLVTGDRWYNPTTGKTGFWSGLYWLGDSSESKSYSASTSSDAYGNTSDTSVPVFKRGSSYEIFAEKIIVDFHSTNITGSNYWNYLGMGIAMTPALSYYSPTGGVPTTQIVSSDWTRLEFSNRLLTTTYRPMTLLHYIAKVGTPGNANVLTSYTTREILA